MWGGEGSALFAAPHTPRPHLARAMAAPPGGAPRWDRVPSREGPEPPATAPERRPPPHQPLSGAYAPADWAVVRRLGSGSYADVVEAVWVGGEGRGDGPHTTHPRVALKIVDKHLLLRAGASGAARTERATMDALRGTQGVVELLFTFQDAHSLFFGAALAPNGELLTQIQAATAAGVGGLEERRARAYAAEVVDILASLRAAGVAHRDVKPENLVLDARGHLVLVDFGCATWAPGREPVGDAVAPAPPPPRHPLARRPAPQMPGTADYVPPEALGGAGESGSGSSEPDCDPSAPTPSPHPAAADVWALGCVTFQMLTGAPPFRGRAEHATFQKIAAGAYAWPPSCPASPPARAFVAACLEPDPGARLGAGGASELKAHAWFSGVEWDLLRENDAPFTPPPPPDPDDVDWGLASLAAAAAGPLLYEHEGGGAGAALGGGLHGVSAAAAAAIGTVRETREEGEDGDGE